MEPLTLPKDIEQSLAWRCLVGACNLWHAWKDSWSSHCRHGILLLLALLGQARLLSRDLVEEKGLTGSLVGS